jgi:hypothetical protein
MNAFPLPSPSSPSPSTSLPFPPLPAPPSLPFPFNGVRGITPGKFLKLQMRVGEIQRILETKIYFLITKIITRELFQCNKVG